MSRLIPDLVLETDIAILGIKGSGKSVCAKGLVERVLDMGRRVCVIDPLSHWPGMKTLADGSPGYPLVVIGGEQADLPLDPEAGEAWGQIVAASEHSFIFDLGDLTRSEFIAFNTAFLRSLFKHNRQALWLILEEADTTAPQQPAMDGTRAMLDMADQIARRGRQRGFRLWTVTQRPARINKDVLSMASALVLMRIRGPQDRAAAEEWVKGHASREETKMVVDGLAGLEIGEGFVYAPDAELLAKVRMPMIRTLDTSRTPQPGERPVEVKTMASVDLTALRAQIAAAAPKVSPTPLASTGALSSAQRAVIREHGYREGFTDGYRHGLGEGMDILKPLMTKLQTQINGHQEIQ